MIFGGGENSFGVLSGERTAAEAYCLKLRCLFVGNTGLDSITSMSIRLGTSTSVVIDISLIHLASIDSESAYPKCFMCLDTTKWYLLGEIRQKAIKFKSHEICLQFELGYLNGWFSAITSAKRIFQGSRWFFVLWNWSGLEYIYWVILKSIIYSRSSYNQHGKMFVERSRIVNHSFRMDWNF